MEKEYKIHESRTTRKSESDEGLKITSEKFSKKLTFLSLDSINVIVQLFNLSLSIDCAESTQTDLCSSSSPFALFKTQQNNLIENQKVEILC